MSSMRSLLVVILYTNLNSFILGVTIKIYSHEIRISWVERHYDSSLEPAKHMLCLREIKIIIHRYLAALSQKGTKCTTIVPH